MSPCQGLGGMEGLAPWARAHGYIMPPRLGLKHKRGTQKGDILLFPPMTRFLPTAGARMASTCGPLAALFAKFGTGIRVKALRARFSVTPPG